jgi:hypothetical protein
MGKTVNVPWNRENNGKNILGIILLETAQLKLLETATCCVEKPSKTSARTYADRAKVCCRPV